MNCHKDLSYPLPRFSRYIVSAFFDLFLVLLLGSVFLFVSQQIMKSTSSFKNLRDVESSIRLESKLYVQGEYVMDLSEHFKKEGYSRSEKIDRYEENLTYFFNDFLDEAPSFEGEKTYLSDKISAKENGESLFDSQGVRRLLNSDYDHTYLSFYEKEYSSVALGMLYQLPRYHQNSLAIFTQEILYAIGSFSLSHIVVYLVIPLCFTRGKKTLGMFFTHLSAVGNDGLSISWWRELAYWAFEFFFLFWGSILTFLIPLGISLGMVILRKDRLSLAGYVCGVHVIDSQNQKVFRNILEVADYENKKQ